MKRTETLAYRRRQSSPYVPATDQAPFDRRSAEAGLFGPCGHRLRYAVERQDSVVPSIALLNCGRHPSAILGAIRAVDVDAIQRMTDWARAHVGQEVIEQRPSLANSDTSPTVQMEFPVTRVGASLNHASPGIALRRIRHHVAPVSRTNKLALPAATRARITGHKISADDRNFGSAFALTQPDGLACRRPSISCHGSQSAKASTRQVEWFCHD